MRSRTLFGLAASLLLAGCGTKQFWVLEPRGPVAVTSVHSILVDFGAMMLIIGPTTLLLLWCIWRYRRSTNTGDYRPGWSHSLPIEIVSWGFPLLIVAFLSYVSYRGTYDVNPFAPGVMARGVNPDTLKNPIDIDVITTDWQWLFVYRDQHVAVSNELVIPVHTPIRFRMTSATVENDILIPQLMGEIDIMPGMQTKQGLIANVVGTYQGMAADFNGPGFSWMQFKTRVLAAADFQKWVETAQNSPKRMDQVTFEQFATPTINKDGTVTLFSRADTSLLDNVEQQVMSGATYDTPYQMIEKKGSLTHGKQQMNSATQASRS